MNNKVLNEIFQIDDDFLPNEEFLKACVHKMFFELDKDHERLEIYIGHLVSDIKSINECNRTEH
jgi:hypothetical protein